MLFKTFHISLCSYNCYYYEDDQRFQCFSNCQLSRTEHTNNAEQLCMYGHRPKTATTAPAHYVQYKILIFDSLVLILFIFNSLTNLHINIINKISISYILNTYSYIIITLINSHHTC